MSGWIDVHLVKATHGPVAQTLGVLRRDECPTATSAVEVIETHQSWVFLTHSFAYKLKKPVRGHYADLSTAAARLRNCRAEVRLNRRIAPATYLGVTSLNANGARLELDGPGPAVDYLVKMRRLPAQRMLDALVRSSHPSAIDVSALLSRLCVFYMQQVPVRMGTGAFAKRFLRECSNCQRELARANGATHSLQAFEVCAALRNFVYQHTDILERRVREGRIIDGHGDLRPEHICLTDPPVVFDCLEFSRSLRVNDPAAELSFLALELERLGAPSLGDEVLSQYRARTSDPVAPELITFYKAFAAMVRAKLSAWHLADPGERGARHWHERIQIYLGYATRYASRLSAQSAGRRSLVSCPR